MKSIITEYKAEDSKLIYRLVVKLKDDFCFREYKRYFVSPSQIRQWVEIDKVIPCAQFRKLFTSISSERISQLVNQAKARDLNYHPPNFLNYFTFDLSTFTEAKKALDKLLACKTIDSAYMEINPICPPTVHSPPNPLAIHQNYLDPAPIGIDAAYAWQFKGGDGSGVVKFIDIEQGWMTHHKAVLVSTLPLSGINHPSFKDHGTAVMGIISMKDNRVGGIGITPHAKGYILSQWRPDGYFNIADALLSAIHYLNSGDILLIQSQAYDDRTEKAMPVEIFDANFHLIRLASALGIIVIEPAGNGNDLLGFDLDLFTDQTGKTPLNRASKDFRDSGAIMVAATTSNIPHQRIPFSNYGSRVDCYAWGENVWTAGSFPEQSGEATDAYTKCFSGTSSASAIITGSVISLQSIVDANLHYRLSPSEMRSVLCNPLLGTLSSNALETDKIGVMPDLKRIIMDALNLRLPLLNENPQNRLSPFQIKNAPTIW
jgi:hypothetical protein